jgi:hypothetical protein
VQLRVSSLVEKFTSRYRFWGGLCVRGFIENRSPPPGTTALRMLDFFFGEDTFISIVLASFFASVWVTA